MARWTDVIPKYWERLEDEIRKAYELSGPDPKHSKLRQAHYAVRAEAEGNMDGFVPRSHILGYAARVKTKDAAWQEFAWFYVTPLRGFHGGLYHLGQMVGKLVAKAPPDIKFFGITRKLPDRLVFERHGLVAVTKDNFPDVEEWAKQLGIRDRLPESALRTSPPDPKEGERWLFVQLSRL